MEKNTNGVVNNPANNQIVSNQNQNDIFRSSNQSTSFRASQKIRTDNMEKYKQGQVVYHKNLALGQGILRNIDNRQTRIFCELPNKRKKVKNENPVEEQAIAEGEGGKDNNVENNGENNGDNNGDNNGENKVEDNGENLPVDFINNDNNNNENCDLINNNEQNQAQLENENKPKEQAKKPKKHKKAFPHVFRKTHREEVNEIENLKKDEEKDTKKKKVVIFNNRKNNALCSELLRQSLEDEKELLSIPYSFDKLKKKKQFHTIGPVNNIPYQRTSMLNGSGNSKNNFLNIIRDSERKTLSKAVCKAKIDLNGQGLGDIDDKGEALEEEQENFE